MLGKLFKRGAGDDWRKIRKDAGELTYEDLQRFAAWEFCLDEEHVPGQTECTVRPVQDVGTSADLLFDGFIPADITFADGSGCFGTVSPTTGSDGPTLADTEIWLPKRAQEYVSEPLPSGWNQVIRAEAIRIGLGSLASEKYLPHDRAQELFRLAYAVLGTTREKMWPLTVTPRIAIAGWPPSWQLQGWRRAGTGEVLR
jgi:hypothetical protein